MAKVLNPLGGVAASGTVQGLTFQNWRGITVVRKKPTPTQPQTERQLKMRAIVTELARYWKTSLTDGLRQAWEEFSRIFTWQDVFGRELQLSGISLFIKMNAVLRDAGYDMQRTPPPSVDPSDVDYSVAEVDANGVRIHLNPVSIAEYQSQSPFTDIWVCTPPYNIVKTGESIEATIRGLPPGRKAGKSDMRHLGYWVYPDPDTQPGPYLINIGIESPEAGAQRRVVILLRKYNKFGRYSALAKVDVLTLTG